MALSMNPSSLIPDIPALRRFTFTFGFNSMFDMTGETSRRLLDDLLETSDATSPAEAWAAAERHVAGAFAIVAAEMASKGKQPQRGV